MKSASTGLDLQSTVYIARIESALLLQRTQHRHVFQRDAGPFFSRKANEVRYFLCGMVLWTLAFQWPLLARRRPHKNRATPIKPLEYDTSSYKAENSWHQIGGRRQTLAGRAVHWPVACSPSTSDRSGGFRPWVADNTTC
jgi:hypothetical protein